MAQYLSDYLFGEYEDEAIVSASQRGFPVNTYMKPESISAMFDDDNIILTSLIIICNYMRDVFGKSTILPAEAVQNLGTGYI